MIALFLSWFDHVLCIRIDDGLSDHNSLVSFWLCCCFNFAGWFYFCHCVKFHALWLLLTRMNWFCFCCFLVSFLWWSQTFECDFVASPWESKTSNIFQAIWEPMMKFMVTQFWTLLVRSMSPSVENFLVGHIWACGLIMPGQGKVFLRCFIDAVWTPHLTSRGNEESSRLRNNF